MHPVVAGRFISLRPRELLAIPAQVPHAVIGGRGRIEHFGIRTPYVDDKVTIAALPATRPPELDETQRTVMGDWGQRLALRSPEFQNCWLDGGDRARYASAYFSMMYLNFGVQGQDILFPGEQAGNSENSQISTLYVVLRGSLTLKNRDQTLLIEAGQILHVIPGTVCTVAPSATPFEGLALFSQVRPKLLIYCPDF